MPDVVREFRIGPVRLEVVTTSEERATELAAALTLFLCTEGGTWFAELPPEPHVKACVTWRE